MTAASLALVESPTQLVNVIELAYVDPELAGVRIAVLAPTVGPTRVQLRAMVGLARQAGHEVVWLEPRMGGASVARTVAALASDLGKVDRLVVGDPFSGVIQVIITVTRAREVTIVDDGTATLEFARQWVAGEQLSRWHRVATPHQRRQIAELARDQIAGSARRRLSSELGCRLRLFTSLPVKLPRVATVANDFGWVRSREGQPEVKATADLVGTSLVESGVVEGDAYLMGVERLVARHNVDRYFAHRKEADWKLDLIGRLGVRVVRPDLPLEIVARRGPIGARVLSFPSTVVYTLPVVLAGVAAELVVCPIPAGWYAAGASRRADAFLDHVSTSASRRHGLLEMAC